MFHWSYRDHRRVEGSPCARCSEGTLRHLTWRETVSMHGSASNSAKSILTGITGLPSTWGRAMRAEYRQLKNGGYIRKGYVIRCDGCLTYHILHSTHDCDAVWPVDSRPSSYMDVNCAGCHQTLVVVPDDGDL